MITFVLNNNNLCLICENLCESAVKIPLNPNHKFTQINTDWTQIECPIYLKLNI